VTYLRRTVDSNASHRCTRWLTLVVLTGLAGCGKAPPVAPPALPPITIVAPVQAKVKASMTLTAAKDVNPDATGKPKPIVVRVYTLRADAMFSSADFFALFNEEEKTLGAEMITHDEYILDPGEQKKIDIAISDETRFVGVIAAFRDIRNAQPWRLAIPAPKGSFTISVERSRVAASATAG
jgi:type VI secretion system protein VasD